MTHRFMNDGRSPIQIGIDFVCVCGVRGTHDEVAKHIAEAVPIEELRGVAVRLADIPKQESKSSWGLWTFDEHNLVVRYTKNNYEVDLERCTTSAQALDWIAQITNKLWASPDDVTDVIHALDDLIGLQENLCGFGKEHVFLDVREIINKRRQTPTQDTEETVS